jgi:glutathione S-transferase
VLGRRFTYLAQHLANRPYLLGETFSIADAYLFTVLGWTNFLKIDLGPWPVLGAYLGRIAARASVQAALKAEGLAK